VIAWELIAQRPLFPTGNDASTLLAIVNHEAPRLGSVRADVPPALEAAVAHALARDPRRRCPTAAAFARQIEAACGGDLELADREEVAACVKRLLGPELAERRAASAARLEQRRRPEGAVEPLRTETASVASVRLPWAVERRSARVRLLLGGAVAVAVVAVWASRGPSSPPEPPPRPAATEQEPAAAASPQPPAPSPSTAEEEAPPSPPITAAVPVVKPPKGAAPAAKKPKEKLPALVPNPYSSAPR